MAADSVLFCGWNRAYPGREKAAVELFNTTLNWWGKQKAAGKVESIEPVILSAHGGDMNGFLIVRGDAVKLAEVARSEEFQDIVTQATVLVQGFGVVHGWTGEGVAHQMNRYMKIVSKL